MIIDDALMQMGEAVETRADFLKFLEALHNDFERHGETWENRSLGSYLEALGAWSVDSEGYYANNAIAVDPNQPSWRLFAEMLLAAIVYE